MAHASPRRERAFTLVELLAVIAIMTVIAGLLLAAAVGARRRADSAAAQAGVDFITAQIEAYYNKRGLLPGDINADGAVGIDDAIAALLIMIDSYDAVFTPGADVNGDDKIGMEEVIYILETVSGVRQQ